MVANTLRAASIRCFAELRYTIRGKLLESRQLNDRNAAENERANIYSEIVVPICELRKDCPIFYKNNNIRMGYTKGARPPMTWNQIIEYYQLQKDH